MAENQENIKQEEKENKLDLWKLFNSIGIVLIIIIIGGSWFMGGWKFKA